MNEAELQELVKAHIERQEKKMEETEIKLVRLEKLSNTRRNEYARAAENQLWK